tara:strand:- start:2233 stop:2628 length:396 start_codon:yes stop_codon:yes gene_type:complete
MAKRDYPNDYFCWYNDDERLAILCLDTTSTDSSERTNERWDTYQSDDTTNGLRITYHSKYEKLTSLTDSLKNKGGLDSGLHNSIVCYVKARLLEDAGDIQKAQYFRAMYERTLKQYPSRKSGVRGLSVPRL